jgi:hypothetical protein
VTLTVTRLADRLGGTADTKTQFSTDYASRYVRFVDTTAQELRLRVYVTPAGGRLNLPGHPHALAVYPGPDADATLEKPMLPRLQAAGFVIQKDIWGVKLCRGPSRSPRPQETTFGSPPQRLSRSATCCTPQSSCSLTTAVVSAGAVAFHRSVKRPAAVGSRAKR